VYKRQSVSSVLNSEHLSELRVNRSSTSLEKQSNFTSSSGNLLQNRSAVFTGSLPSSSGPVSLSESNSGSDSATDDSSVDSGNISSGASSGSKDQNDLQLSGDSA
jgi:hypothetical protein